MKKIFLSSFVIISFLLYSLFTKKSTALDANLSATPPLNNNVKLYKDGIYIGDVVDAFYGNVQVQANIQNGQITEIQFLQYPNDRDRSREISQMSIPIL